MVSSPKISSTQKCIASLLPGPFMGELVHRCLDCNELLEHVQLNLSCPCLTLWQHSGGRATVFFYPCPGNTQLQLPMHQLSMATHGSSICMHCSTPFNNLFQPNW